MKINKAPEKPIFKIKNFILESDLVDFINSNQLKIELLDVVRANGQFVAYKLFYWDLD